MKTSWVVLTIVLCLAAVIGTTGGVALFFLHRPSPSAVIAPPATAPSEPAPITDAALYATYAGSSTCKECHAKAYDLWVGSHHGLAERDPDPAIDKPAFDPPRKFKHGSQETQLRAMGDRLDVVTAGPDGKPAAYSVARVIGVDPLLQYLVPALGGRFQTLEASYDPNKKEWFNVYGEEDRKFGEWGHWSGRGMNWNSQCAICHNTRVHKNYDEATDSYQTAMAQKTVSCEACHGPMKHHVDAKKKGGLAASAAGSSAAGSSAKPYKLTSVQMLETCASCHARRADITGDFAPGDLFADHFSLSIPDLSDLFYPDAQIREEDYEYTSFLGSKMHAAGIRCGDCHEPHSSKRLFEGNALCMRCHNGSFKGSPVIVPDAHSFHKSDSTGNQCVNCHMPQTTYMQRHSRHDHGFRVPDPLLTKEHGIPNACNKCHQDKDVEWAIKSVDERYGAKMQRHSRERARILAKARRGDEDARGKMIAMLAEEKQPFWQAVAAAMLAQWIGLPDAQAALITATNHADPLVRENAARSLSPLVMGHDPAASQAMIRLLDDPVRSVRLRAAWGLRDQIKPTSVAGRDLQRMMKYNADQPTGAAEQGSYYAARGDLNSARSYFEKAIAWDPGSPPFRDNLANVLILQGETNAALEQLKWALKLNPREPLYAYKLALTYERLGQKENARAAAQRALEIDPKYNAAAEFLKTLGP